MPRRVRKSVQQSVIFAFKFIFYLWYAIISYVKLFILSFGNANPRLDNDKQ